MKSVLENSKSTKKTKRDLGEGKYWMLGAKKERGETIRNRLGIIQLAVSFYEELYDSESALTYNDLKRTEEEEELKTVLNGEAENATIQLKNTKTPCEEGVINECLKWGEQDLIDPITTLFNRILVMEIVPQQWFTSTIILLHEKGAKDNLNNYRPICLLSNMYHLFMKILTNRITVTLDENQQCEQAGFMAKFSTIDHLQTINQVIEKTQEFNLSLYLAFVDYKKAFDLVEHTSVMEALNSVGIHPKII
jgi:hypothetical protein